MKIIIEGGTPMSKLNALGLELLDLKTAIAADYPAIVKRSLVQTADDLLKNEIIDQETHYLLTEPVFAWNDFKNFCLDKKAYCKTEEELLSLYEDKRIRLEESLHRCIEQQQVSVVNYIKEEQIMVVKAYRFGVHQVQAYFGIENLDDCQALMGRKRFVERFIALRYPKIMKEFVGRHERPTGYFKLGHSSVYYDEETEEYVIELLLKIDIGTFEEVEISAFERPMVKVIERCNRWFGDYLGVDGNFYAPHRNESKNQKPQPKPQQSEPVKTKPSVETPKKEDVSKKEASKKRWEIKPEKVEEETQTVQPLKPVDEAPVIKEMTPLAEARVFEEPTLETEFEIGLDLPEVNFQLPDIELDFNPDEIL